MSYGHTDGGPYRVGTYSLELPHHPVIEVVTAPASPNDLAISVSEVKDHLSYPSEDTAIEGELTAFIRAAMAMVESYCQITLLSTVFRSDTPYLESNHMLRMRPFTSFDKIERVQPSDAEIVTVDADLYHVLNATQLRGQVFLGKGLVWPDTAERQDGFRITYTAGWTPSTVPADMKNALLQIVAKLDASRGDCDGGGAQSVYAMKNATATGLPPAATAILDKYKLQELFSL